MAADGTAEFDVSEVLEFASNIYGALPLLRREIPKVIKRGAQNIKTDSQKLYRAQAGKHGRGHAWRYPATIGYDITRGKSEATATIGPDKNRLQGALGNLLEYGSAKNAAMPHLGPALKSEAPRTEKALADSVAIVLSRL